MRVSFIGVKDLHSGGGLETYTREVASELALAGHDVRIYSSDKRNTVYTDKGYKVVNVGLSNLGPFTKPLSSLVAAFLTLFTTTDVIHVQGFGCGLAVWTLNLFGKNVVVQGHGIEWLREGRPKLVTHILKINEYLSIKYSTHILTVSAKQALDIQKRYKRHATHIHGGVSNTMLDDKSEIRLVQNFTNSDKPYLACISRIVPEKRIDFICAAFEEAGCQNLDLVIAGGIDSKYSKSIYEIYKENKNIHFLGYQNKEIVQSLLHFSSAYINASTLEGYCLTIVEAMACFSPVVVSNIEENLEVTHAEKYGVVFTNNQKSELAKIIRDIDQQTKSYEEMREKAIKAQSYVSETHRWSIVANNLSKYYFGMLRNE